MNFTTAIHRGLLLAWVVVCCFGGQVLCGQQAGTNSAASPAVILELEGKVLIQRAGAKIGDPAYVNQRLYVGDLIHTGPEARALLRLSDQSNFRLGERSDLVIQTPEGQTNEPSFSLLRGLLYLFHRDKPGTYRVKTRTATAAIRGTEFNLEVDDRGTTILTMIDGVVDLAGEQGPTISLVNGQQGTVEIGKAAVLTSVLVAENQIIQWCLYYPAVLDADELDLTPEQNEALAESLAAYRSGDLPNALAKYPAGREPSTAAENIYRAAVLLAVGQVQSLDAGGFASPDARQNQLANALRLMTETVKNSSQAREFNPQRRGQADPFADLTASECLAVSYFEQAQFKLDDARKAARRAIEKSPRFGFAWERLAELEFGFGHTGEAMKALEQALEFSPRNAQAHALKGFVLAARGKIDTALTSFEQAISIDGALGNAWLGRGLCRIRQGQADAGRQDLLAAATLEPQRAPLRSYLGKAYNNEGDPVRAAKELQLAIKLDPNDPTAWLYSALLNQQENRINQGIADLEESVEKNYNRRVYRSRLLLDQDQAVRGANLAAIYRDAGMTEVSVREAARAVTYDYANASAHLFLSDSYNELRDPTRFNLRYETVWFNELLLANLLSPVGGGRLAQHVSQQEYSKLFEVDGLHLANSTLARTDGMFTELASQFGTLGGSSYALDLDYQHNNGIRPNNDLDSIEWYTTVKQQVTPQDSALVLVKYEDYHSGDNFQYYDPSQARRNFRFDEYQHPILVAAWHHEWSPGMHTLALAGRLINEQYFKDRDIPEILLLEDATGALVSRASSDLDVNYHSNFEIYSAELNQIFERDWFTLSAGARYQSGTFRTQDFLDNPSRVPFLLGTPPAAGSTADGFERITGYGYATVRPLERLWLTGGLAYNQESIPRNFRHPPITPGEDDRSQVGPKAALVWSPLPQATLRGAYTRSLGGVSLDESYRLEPTALAGFPQAFRSLISESVPGVGSVAAPAYETFGLALDLKFGPRTYAGIEAQRVTAAVRRSIGVFTLKNGNSPAVPDSIAENLDYEERTLAVSLNRIIGDEIVAGATYKLTQADLNDVYPETPVSILSTANPSQHAELHRATAYLLFNHPSGFFARAEMHWYHQHNSGYTPALPGDDFFQENLFVGYRFAQRHAELRLGLRNLTGQDYHLNPLTVYEELPRKRVFEARLNFAF